MYPKAKGSFIWCLQSVPVMKVKFSAGIDALQVIYLTCRDRSFSTVFNHKKFPHQQPQQLQDETTHPLTLTPTTMLLPALLENSLLSAASLLQVPSCHPLHMQTLHHELLQLPRARAEDAPEETVGTIQNVPCEAWAV